jgi:hypothetical protein
MEAARLTEAMPMSDDRPENLSELAEEYLQSLEFVPSKDSEKLREELEYWEEQVQDFEEETPMHEMAIEERDEVQEQLDAMESKGKRYEELRTELLTRASREFAPHGEWLDPNAIEALSHALTGRRMGRLLVGGHNLPEDADEMSKREMVPVAKTVHALAEDAIGNNERVDALWDTLNTETQCSILGVLARYEESISSGEISDKLGEDGTNSPGANIRRLKGEVEIKPYHSTDEGYTLTLAGRYVWKQYGPDTEDLISDADGNESGSERETEDQGEEESGNNKSGNSTSDVDLSSFEMKE